MISDKSTLLFNSPNLSPVKDFRPHLYHASPGVSHDTNGRSTHNDVSTSNGGQRNDDEMHTINGQRQKHGCKDRGQKGLSPVICKSIVGNSLSAGGPTRSFRQALSPRKGFNIVSRMAAVKEAAELNGGGSHNMEGRRKGLVGLSSREEAESRLQAPRGVVADQSQSSGPIFMDSSSVDMTRSSLLRESTTLETIAPLDDDDDDTGRSFSFHSRAGVAPFPGELFADGKLPPASEPPPSWYGANILPQRGYLRRGNNGTSLPPPQLPQENPRQQQRRSKSAPTLASECSVGDRHIKFGQERQLAAGDMSQVPPPHGFLPAVVEAWLTAAIEEKHFHKTFSRGDSYSGSGEGGSVGNRVDSMRSNQRIDVQQQPQSVFDRGPLDHHVDNSAIVRQPFVDLRRKVASIANQPKAARTSDIMHNSKDARCEEYARGARVGLGLPAAYPGAKGGHYPPSSPPPPPPKGPVEDGNSSDGGDEATEEEIFYQRQRLLQRVVSAAAGHGGVLPPLLSVRGTSYENSNGETMRKIEEEFRRDRSKGDYSLRRHSDPLSRRKPALATAAAAAAAPRDIGGTTPGEWVSTRGTSAYLRRQTSGYWRERLGMTQ